MKIELLNKDYAEISFANQAKVSIKTQDGHETEKLHHPQEVSLKCPGTMVLYHF